MRHFLSLTLWIAAFAPAASHSQEAVIAEFLAENVGGRTDADGDSSDWIEIQNVGQDCIDVGGWFLTDDLERPQRWQLPSGSDVTRLEPGESLVVFASGKDRLGSELHTSFRLRARGEPLALVRPDGSVAHALLPEFPPQRADVSYGLRQFVERTALVTDETPVRYRAAALVGAAAEWVEEDFDDADWPQGVQALGFDRGEDVPPAAGTRNLALGGSARQSTTGFAGVAARAIDGNTSGIYTDGSVTHTATGDPAPFWELDLGSHHAIERAVLWNRTGCCPHRLANFRVLVFEWVDGQRAVTHESAHFTDAEEPRENPYTVLFPPGTRGRFVRIEKLGVDPRGENYLSLAEVEVFEATSRLRELIATDVESELAGRVGLYVRIPFLVADPSDLGVLELSLQLVDGGVAYINGEEVARLRAPALLERDALASDRAPADAATRGSHVRIAAAGRLRQGRNVLAVHALSADPAADTFFVRASLRQEVVVTESAPRYLLTPTPGATNSSTGVLGFLSPPSVRPQRGFFAEPIAVEFSSEEGDEILYTTDGSLPTRQSAMVYDGAALVLSATTTLRAVSVRDDYQDSSASTHTYLFPSDIVHQDGAGFPASWGVPADYAMDPDVVDSPAYGDTIQQDLQTLPVVSIVMDTDDLFGPSGIYSNTEARGGFWERPCSVEMIYPDAERGHQVDCGVRIHGFGWRPHSASMKHSFRVNFRREYGEPTLDYRFFRDWPTASFDELILRSQGSRGWNDFRVSIEQTQYLRDAFARYTARDMGKLTTPSSFVHLYLNGLYWGLYNPVERPTAEFLTARLGGDEEDYVSYNARTGTLEAIDGSLELWSEVMALSAGDVEDPAVYAELADRVDLDDLIQYMLIQFYTVNRDWQGANGNNLRVAGAPGEGGGLKTFCWDMEYSIWDADDNVLGIDTSFQSAATLYQRLLRNDDFRLRVADAAARHLGPGGALSPEEAAARFRRLSDEIDRAIVGESARWGDRRREAPYTRDVEWVRERDRLFGSFFPRRSAILLEQLKLRGTFPVLDAPVFREDRTGDATRWSLTARKGRLLYTLDGSDPRADDGSVSPDALEYGVVEESVLVAAGDEARFVVPADGADGLAWTRRDFDDSAWNRGPIGIGFDRRTSFDEFIATDVEGLLYNQGGTLYLRIEFEVEDPTADFLVLRVRYDDGFVAYLNGERVASDRAPDNPTWDATARRSRLDSLAVTPVDFFLDESRELLKAGRNVLAIHALNLRANSDDFLIVPELIASRLTGEEVLVERRATVKTRIHADGEWSVLRERTFAPRTPTLRVTEIHYHPAVDEGSNGDALEFLELTNVGERTLSLAGLRLQGGVRFAFDATRSLPPAGVGVLVRDRDAFERHYEVDSTVVLGEFEGGLSNGLDTLVLVDTDGVPFWEMTYLDSWYRSTDGEGFSLEHAGDPVELKDWGRRASWRPSAQPGGSPGIYEPAAADGASPGGRQRVGDVDQSGRLSLADAVLWTRLLFGRELRLPCSGTLFERGNVQVLDINGDGRLDLSDPLQLLHHLFLGGSPPDAGNRCRFVVGCAEVCEA